MDSAVPRNQNQPNAHASEPPKRLPLTQLRKGQTGTVCGSDLSPGDRRLLTAMGLRHDAEVVLCRLGEPCIVRVMGGCSCSSRIGLARPLAERVYVRPTPRKHPERK